MLNDFRKDYLLDRWVVIATHRKRRPTDFKMKGRAAGKVDKNSCPFCPGNEKMTPPAVLVYLKSKAGKIVKEKDRNGMRRKNWLIRCVPNLYSAFSPPEKEKETESCKAIGHHEVLIESPTHSEHPAIAKVSQLIHVVNGYVDRLTALSAKPYVKYISIFRNHGLEAGASLSHTHSQIIATPKVPRIFKEELEASKTHFEKYGNCVFCDILERERKGPRHVWENGNFIAFAPWASVHPFEFWILPKKHQSTLLDTNPQAVEELAETLKACFSGLKLLLDDPPYNFGFHIAPNGEDRRLYHWHLEIYPRLSIWAGFEKSTGMYINVVPPEDAARALRDSIE